MSGVSNRPGDSQLAPSENAAEDVGSQDAHPTRARRRRPRRAVYISEADRHLLELGLPPSWDQRVSDADLDMSNADVERSDNRDGSASNDRRLLEAVPPHSHARM